MFFFQVLTLQIGFSVQPVEVKKHSNHVLKTLFDPRIFWSYAGIRRPVATFLVLYYAIFCVYFLGLKDACTDRATMRKDKFASVNCTDLTPNRATFQMEVAQYSKMHVESTRILTFFLGFFVASMMKRWWDQVTTLPDISQVAMVLNGLVKSGKDSLSLKKTILRYCLLSYNAVMINITKNARKSKMMVEDPEEKGLLLPGDADQFNMKNSRNWWVPINHACGIVQDHPEMIKDVKDVVVTIGKFQESLHKLTKFHENPLPTLCVQVVHLACWMYVFLGSFALQDCSQSVAWWTPLLVSLTMFLLKEYQSNLDFRISLSFHFSSSSYCLLGSVWVRSARLHLMGTAFTIWTWRRQWTFRFSMLL